MLEFFWNLDYGLLSSDEANELMLVNWNQITMNWGRSH
jgi:hypothetical protein